MGEKYPALRYRNNIDRKFEGVWEMECRSWGEFVDRIKEIQGYKYFWRGQRCVKELKPSIYRDSAPDIKTIERHLCQFKKDMLGGDALDQFFKGIKEKESPEFDKALSEYYNMICPKNNPNDPKENYIEDFIDDIYWAIGRHQGLKTPILDWTTDPYKALFFAFCGQKEKDTERIVFGFAEKSRLLLSNEKTKKRYMMFLNNLNFVQTISDSLDSQPDFKGIIRPMFARIKAQNGIFSKSLQNESVEKHAQRCSSYYENHRNQKIVFLIRILFPNDIRRDILQKLESEKITYKTMYPDLFGSVSYCNYKLELCSRM